MNTGVRPVEGGVNNLSLRLRHGDCKAKATWQTVMSERLGPSRTAGSRRGLYRVTKPVKLKATVRVCADLSPQDGEPEEGRVERWTQRLAPWSERVRDFRNEGCYERFPTKGQVDRVARIHRELARAAGMQSRTATK